MPTSVQTLPQDLSSFLSKNKLFVHDYYAATACNRNKINLKLNVFSFLVDGTKEIIHFNNNKRIDNTQFLLIKSGNCLMTENLSEKQNYRSILLFFDDETLQKLINKHHINTRQHANTHTDEGFLVFDYDAYIKNFVQTLLQLKNTPNALQETLFETKLEEIMLYLIGKQGSNFLNNFAKNNQNQQHLNFKKNIEQNINNKLHVEDLAFLCHMSLSTFKRQFFKTYNHSPIKWFQEKRLEQSALLLKTQQQRPSDLYHDAGFENLSSFTQAFKHKFGTTPKKYQSQ